jgi:hypothetical protein
MTNLDVQRALELRAQVARERDGQNVVVGNTDPSVERHSDELFGQPSEPDFSPIDIRYVPPKKALIEWVGEPSPFDSELVRALRLKGLLLPIHRLVLEKIALMRQPRIDRVTSMSLGPRDGLSQIYRWGKMPGTFVIEVEFADVDKILTIGQSGLGKSINQFRILGKHSDASPVVMPDEAWAKVIAKLSAQEGIPGLPPGAERLRVRTGEDQPLVGINKAGTYGQWRTP